MAEYIDIDHPLIFKDIRNRDVTGTIRTLLKANHTELVLADVAPVRHGKWIIKDKHIYQCNRCGNYLDIRGLNGGRGDANYCPNCGADMREVSE